MRITTPLTGLALGLLLLTGCGGNDTAEPPPKSSGAGSPSTETSADKGPEPVLLGSQRYTSPCRLLPTEELISIYGATGPYASVDQEIIEDSVPAAEMREINRSVGSAVDSKCLYRFDNRAETTVTLEVDQYSSPGRALRAWKRTKRLGTGIESKQLAGQPDFEWLLEMVRENEASMGGVPVRGLDPTVLFVAGKTNFVGVRRNLVVTLTRGDYAGRAFMPKQVKGTLAATRRAFRAVYAHIDEPELDQSPAPARWDQPDRWPTFLEPCEILDAETATIATTRAEIKKVEVSSTPRDPDTRIQRNDTPGGRSVSNTCNRMTSLQRSRTRTDYFHTDLELIYLAPGDKEEDLLESWLVRRNVKEEARAKVGLPQLVQAKVVRATEVEGADQAYVFEYKRSGLHYSYILVRTGPYVFKLDATASKPKDLGTVPVPEAKLVAASKKVVAHIKAATKDA